LIRYLSRRPLAVAAVTAAVDICLVVAKLGLGLLTGSLALISDAVHSGLDAAASVLTFFAVRTAAHPADREHPFGHGKAENLAAYTEALLLVIAAVIIGYQAFQRLLGNPLPVDPAPVAIGFLVFSILLEVGRTMVLRLVAGANKSASLGALATDKLADLLSVSAVLVGLVAVRLGFAVGDSIAALVVAGLILRAAAGLIRRSVDVLMDRAVSSVEKEVLEAARSVEGVRDARAARVRQSGAQLLGEVEITGRPTLPLEAVQHLAEMVKSAVQERVPGLDATVYVAPGGDPTRLVERVHAAAARNGRFRDLHDVIVEREKDDSIHLSLHAKLPGEMSMREASRYVNDLEGQLRKELPEVSRTDVHLEPLEPDEVHGRDVTEQHADLVGAIRKAVLEHPRVLSCDDVELSSRAGQITAYVTVTVGDDLTLDQAHDLETSLEEQIRTLDPALAHVVVRAVG
jgi:cation diffusion facilitator family transporter